MPYSIALVYEVIQAVGEFMQELVMRFPEHSVPRYQLLQLDKIGAVGRTNSYLGCRTSRPPLF